MEQAVSFRRTLRDWRTWAPIVAWIIAGIAGAQVLTHDLLTGLPMGCWDVASGALQAVLVLVPAALYLAWRRTAEDRAAALAELRDTERMREDLVAMLIHDLKSPAISAGMALDMLLEEPRAVELLDEQDLRMVVSARRNLRRLEGMVSDALQVAAAQEHPLKLHRVTADLCALAAEAIADARPQAEGAAVSVRHESECETLCLQMDAEKVRRVFDNLIANAIGHTPAGGQVCVRIMREPGQARVEVADSGEGISEELRDRVFDRYAQAECARKRQVGSVGLGLAFSRLAVEAHGGRIWVEGSDLGGSSFVFTLPMTESGE